VKGKERYVLPLITFTLVLIAWQAAASLGIWEDYLFPSPLAVAGGILETALNGVLWQHIGISLFRFFTGYLIAAAVAVPLGLIAGWYRNLWVAIDPLVQVLRPISPIAWMPLIALWFGIGNLPAIVIIFLAAFYPMLLSTVAAVKNVDPVYLKVAQNFGTSEKDILRKVVVPAVFPYIMMGMHIALGTAWVFLVAGEMMGVRSGLGFLIVDARNSMRTELVLTGMVIIGVLGLTLDRSIGYLEQRVKKRWGFSA